MISTPLKEEIKTDSEKRILAPKLIFGILIAFNLGLLITHIVFSVMQVAWLNWVDFEAEGNLSSLFAAFLWLSISGLALFSYLSERVPNRKNNLRWLLISITFFYVAIDDFFALHETFLTPFMKSLFADPFWDQNPLTVSFKSGTWMVAYVPLAFLFFILVGPFLWNKISDKYGKLILTIGVVCIASSFGHELIQDLLGYYGGAYEFGKFISPDDWTAGSQIAKDWISISRIIEEVLENFGAIFIVYALSDNLAHNYHHKLVSNTVSK